MKKLTKIMAVVLSMVMLAAMFTSCSEEQENVLKIGTNATFPPFEFTTTGNGVLGEFDGIDMAIVKQIGADMGKDVKIEDMAFDSLLIALQNGQIDAVAAGMTATDERREKVDFSIPYYTAEQVMIVKADSTIAVADDMAGKKIAVIKGYTGESWVVEKKYEYTSFNNGTEAIMELENGKADVVIIDSITAANYVGNKPELKIVKDTEAFGTEQYAIAVKKGNTDLLNKINETLQKMIDDGTIDQLTIQYTV